MSKVLALLTTLLLLLLAGCSTGIAGNDARPAIGGYCPVSYFTAGQAVKGRPEFQTTHAGKTYYFASQQNNLSFQRDPARYLPAYEGWCAYGIAFGRKVPVNPEVFAIVDDRLYLNKNRWVGHRFEEDKGKHIAKADQEWSRLR